MYTRTSFANFLFDRFYLILPQPGSRQFHNIFRDGLDPFKGRFSNNYLLSTARRERKGRAVEFQGSVLLN